MSSSLMALLSRRERQIMDIVFRRGRASAADIQQEMADPPTYSTVRTLLKVLEDKGVLSHDQDGPRYVYFPCVSTEKAKRSALEQVLKTFFNNSAANVMAALMDISSTNISEDELKRMGKMIHEARKRD